MSSAPVFTVYTVIIEYVKPVFVHVIVNGKVVKEGDASLGYEIEKRGFDWIKEELAQ